MNTMENKDELLAYEQPMLMELQLGNNGIVAGLSDGEGENEGGEIDQ